MSEEELTIIETIEEVCDKFCKYSGTGENGECCYCATHEGECPFDKVYKALGLK